MNPRREMMKSKEKESNHENMMRLMLLYEV